MGRYRSVGSSIETVNNCRRAAGERRRARSLRLFGRHEIFSAAVVDWWANGLPRRVAGLSTTTHCRVPRDHVLTHVAAVLPPPPTQGRAGRRAATHSALYKPRSPEIARCGSAVVYVVATIWYRLTASLEQTGTRGTTWVKGLFHCAENRDWNRDWIFQEQCSFWKILTEIGKKNQS